jgi:hypothetical protein
MQLLWRQDQRCAKLEARVGRLEGTEGVESPGAPSLLGDIYPSLNGSAPPFSGAFDLSGVVKGIEARMAQHEAAMRVLGDTVSQATSQNLSREVEHRMSYLEGRLDALWSTLNGESPEAFGLSRSRGMQVLLGEDALGRGGAVSSQPSYQVNVNGMPAITPVMSRESLETAFREVSGGHSSIPTERLSQLFSALGFVVYDTRILNQAIGSDSSGQVTLQDVLAALEEVPPSDDEVMCGEVTISSICSITPSAPVRTWPPS